MSDGIHGGSSSRISVLIIDDAELLLRSFKRVLARDHDVTALSSAGEALRRISAGERWDAILCDLHISDLDGVDFYERLARCQPSLTSRLAFMTGGAFTERIESFILRTAVPTLRKPMTGDDLRALIGLLAGAGAAPCAVESDPPPSLQLERGFAGRDARLAVAVTVAGAAS